jgi:hypothetical protein
MPDHHLDGQLKADALDYLICEIRPYVCPKLMFTRLTVEPSPGVWSIRSLVN